MNFLRRRSDPYCAWAEIAHFKTEVNLELSKSIERVRELHKPFGEENQWCDHCEVGQNSGYEWADYPCDTIKALDGDSQ
jgi:hypothetical protein